MATDSAPETSGQAAVVIGGRYRLELRLSVGPQGILWRGCDQLVGDAPVVVRQLSPERDHARARELWGRLQGVLHPQVPRLGAAISQDGSLWLVREWQSGSTYQDLLRARIERQMVFGAGEVLLLLRQVLPVLAVLHGQDLVHGDLCPANLLRRDGDGLPVLLDYGLVTDHVAVTPGYAPPELARSGCPAVWMDLHALGVLALVLLSGDPPTVLMDTNDGEAPWRWPVQLADLPELQACLARLLERDPGQRYASASQALAASEALEMPDASGPVPRVDSSVLSPVPSPKGLVAPPADPTPVTETLPPAAVPLRAPGGGRPRVEDRNVAAEGGVWPVVMALVLSAVVGTALGWWWLSRGQKGPPTTPDAALQLPSTLPAAEVNQRQQLLNRLRAMQVNRAWFLQLVDASYLDRSPGRRRRLPGESMQDAPQRQIWNALSQEWLARVEQLPLEIRQRLGGYDQSDWLERQRRLVQQGLSESVLQQLVSASTQTMLPGRMASEMPDEPFRQLWYAAAEQSLAGIQIEPIQTQPLRPQVVTALVTAGGARLFPIRLPPGYRLVLGVNGSPLMQMSVFDADGGQLEASGPLRVVNLGPQQRSPVQLLVTHDGVAPALLTLSLRADPPAPTSEAAPVTPEPALEVPLEAAPPDGSDFTLQIPEPPPPEEESAVLEVPSQ